MEAGRQIRHRSAKGMHSEHVNSVKRKIEGVTKDLQMQNNLLDEMESYLFQQDMV